MSKTSPNLEIRKSKQYQMMKKPNVQTNSDRTPLSKILQGIQFPYAQYYNRRQRTVSHLFQDRHKISHLCAECQAIGDAKTEKIIAKAAGL
jgi:hypothetical protein